MVGDRALDYGRDDTEVVHKSSEPVEWVARYTKSRIMLGLWEFNDGKSGIGPFILNSYPGRQVPFICRKVRKPNII